MSLIIKRALRWQQAIQKSQVIAWFVLPTMLAIAVGAGVLLNKTAR